MLLLVLALTDAADSVPALIRLKDGTVYSLRSPPHLTGGRFVFKTSDGRLLSVAETEVDEIRLLQPTPVPRAALNTQDSHALGAIARQQRRSSGKHTLLSPAPTPKPKPNRSSQP
jgi:hypothetical protein